MKLNDIFGWFRWVDVNWTLKSLDLGQNPYHDKKMCLWLAVLMNLNGLVGAEEDPLPELKVEVEQKKEPESGADKKHSVLNFGVVRDFKALFKRSESKVFKAREPSAVADVRGKGVGSSQPKGLEERLKKMEKDEEKNKEKKPFFAKWFSRD